MRTTIILSLLAIVSVGFLACSGPEARDAEVDSILTREVEVAKADVQRLDPGFSRWFNEAYGYAVFPTVGKGGLIVGGAHGSGLVYELGRVIGVATLSQGSIGLQAGGQEFREFIFFQDKTALDQFTSGTFQFAADASAVAVETGAGAKGDYNKGVAVFIAPTAGLMVEAAIGGQQFKFVPHR